MLTVIHFSRDCRRSRYAAEVVESSPRPTPVHGRTVQGLLAFVRQNLGYPDEGGAPQNMALPLEKLANDMASCGLKKDYEDRLGHSTVIVEQRPAFDRTRFFTAGNGGLAIEVYATETDEQAATMEARGFVRSYVHFLRAIDPALLRPSDASPTPTGESAASTDLVPRAFTNAKGGSGATAATRIVQNFEEHYTDADGRRFEPIKLWTQQLLDAAWPPNSLDRGKNFTNLGVEGMRYIAVRRLSLLPSSHEHYSTRQPHEITLTPSALRNIAQKDLKPIFEKERSRSFGKWYLEAMAIAKAESGILPVATPPTPPDAATAELMGKPIAELVAEILRLRALLAETASPARGTSIIAMDTTPP